MADYKKLKPIVRKWEGGFSNNPSDPGGATQYGVTLSTFQSIFGKDKTVEDLKKMTEEQWDHIFKKHYWDKARADEIIHQQTANLIVDWLWTSGTVAIKYSQQALCVEADGIVGPKTLAAINEHGNCKELFEKLWNRRKKHFEDIVKARPSSSIFLKGWLRRLSDFTWD